MELKDFIKIAVRDIADAVSELQDELKNGTLVNPPIECEYPSLNTIISMDRHRMMEIIKFDISVSISESTNKGKKGGLGIKVMSAEIGKNSQNSSESTSRISFQIPVCFPTSTVDQTKGSSH